MLIEQRPVQSFNFCPKFLDVPLSYHSRSTGTVYRASIPVKNFTIRLRKSSSSQRYLSQPIANQLQTNCRPIADQLQTSCIPVVYQLQTSCEPMVISSASQWPFSVPFESMNSTTVERKKGLEGMEQDGSRIKFTKSFQLFSRCFRKGFTKIHSIRE